MDCRECAQLIDELATHDCDIILTPSMQMHVKGCPDCQARLASNRDAWLTVGDGVEPAALPDGLEERLFQRIAATNVVRTSANTGREVFAKYLLAASILALLVAGTALIWYGRNAFTSTDLAKIDDLTRQVEGLDEVERTFKESQLTYVSLEETSGSGAVRGYLVYDLMAKEGHFFGINMVQQDDTHHFLWLLSADNRVISSAEVASTGKEVATAIVKLPPHMTDIRKIIVTVEATGAVDTPSDQIRMMADILPK